MNISEELRNYIEMVEEEWQNDLLFGIANICSRQHGIDNVVIWVGATNKKHGLRIKVSNIPNKMDMNDSFVIRMPNLDYDPTHVAKWIDTESLEKILDWIQLNQSLLYDYEQGIITYTDDFLNAIVKV